MKMKMKIDTLCFLFDQERNVGVAVGLGVLLEEKEQVIKGVGEPSGNSHGKLKFGVWQHLQRDLAVAQPSEIINELPIALQTALIECKYGKLIKSVPFFSKLHRRAVVDLCREIAEGRADLQQLNKQSLIWRGKSRVRT